MKVKSDVQQPSFNYKSLYGIDYVYLYVNETQSVNESTCTYNASGIAEPHIEYEYDFNEFSAKSGTLPLDEIKKNPVKYINYPSDTSTSLETRVTDLEVFMNALLGGANK